MKRTTTVIVSIISSLLLGLLAFLLVGGANEPMPTPTALPTGSTPTTEADGSVAGEPGGASEAGEDIADVLFLYDAQNQSGAFDTNFCLMAEFYGLICERVDLRVETVTAGMLVDANGDPYKLVGIRGAALGLLSDGEVSTLYDAVVRQGTSVLVYETNTDTPLEALQTLTAGVMGGITRPKDTGEEWLITGADPAFTRELTGLTIEGDSDRQRDFGLVWADSPQGEVIISTYDDAGTEYPIFARI